MIDLRESRYFDFPDIISYESTTKIKEQMEKTICKIEIWKGNKEEQGTGFFCKIPFPNRNNTLPVLITSAHLVDNEILEREEKIQISIKDKNDKIEISLKNRIKYTSKQYDTTIIEIKKEDEENIKDYLQLDDAIIEDIINDNNRNNHYNGETIYIIQYPGGKLSVSYGICTLYKKGKDNYDFSHKCSTYNGSSGSAIFKNNNKLIGIHQGGDGYNNFGIFLNYPIKDFIQQNCENIYKNKINIIDNIRIQNEYPNALSLNCSKMIINQMENSICKILDGKEEITGFFCKIPFPDNKNSLDVLITDFIDIKEDTISIIMKETKERLLSLNNQMKYTNKDYNVTIIEIKKENNINIFLKLDDMIINDIVNNKNQNERYIGKTIYITHYSDEKLYVSYGIIKLIFQENKYNFKHKCCTKINASGAPILTENNKVIGIHKELTGYNKGTFLNYPVKEFIKQKKEFILKNNNNDNNNNNNQKEVFKQLKEKYNLIITINDSRIANALNKKKLGNEGLELLCKLKLDKLKTLSLPDNSISNISYLENTKFDQLSVLNLSNNKISNINPLENVNYKNLTELNMDSNQITDINILEKVVFNELEVLSLNNNQISDIIVLERVIFKKLQKLKLFSNKISEIKALGNANFPELTFLNLGKNQISDIKSLENASFKGLKELNLQNNDIKDINILVNFKDLKSVILMYNKNLERGKNEPAIKFFKEKNIRYSGSFK